jgi:hypothetical protein
MVTLRTFSEGESDVRPDPFGTQFDGLQQRNVAVLERDEQRPFAVEKLDDDGFVEGVDGEVERPGAEHVLGVLARVVPEERPVVNPVEIFGMEPPRDVLARKEEVVPLPSATASRDDRKRDRSASTNASSESNTIT